MTAIAAPIPREAPVTRAVLPSRLISVIGTSEAGAVGGCGGSRCAASCSTGACGEGGVDDLERVADVDTRGGEEPGAARIRARHDRSAGSFDGVQLPLPYRGAELGLEGSVGATGAAAQTV